MRRRDLALAFVGLLLAWQLVAWLAQVNVLPGPLPVILALAHALSRGLALHFLVSGWRVVASVVLAMVTAVPAGLVLGQSRLLGRLFAPVVYILYPVPKIVFLPVVLLLLRIGNLSKVFMIYLVLFFQILVVVRDAASNLRPELLYSVRSLGAGRRALFRFVYLPATVPAALTALRVSVGTAIAVLFFVETFATNSGLGYYIMDSWGRLAYPEMYAGVVAMSLLGLLLYFVIDGLERRLAPWLFVEEKI